MKASQYKAIRATGVGEFAIFPADVESKLPWTIEHANKAQSVRACPTGLVRATILKDDAPWKETFTLGCGDTDYQRERRNGVLVEVTLADFRKATKAGNKAIGQMPRTKVARRARRGGERFVEIIVSKRAIMAPWNEYALIEAEREKSQAEGKDRSERMKAAIGGIGARGGSYREVSGAYDKETNSYPPPEDYDYAVRLEHNGRLAYLKGEIVLSLERAEEIAGLLGATGVTP